MRKFLALAAVLLGISLPASALEPAIRSIDISLSLHRDGSATVREIWDVCAASGTEWYLVRNNLGDIDILSLKVSDESGVQYTNVGEWDVDRSISQKARRCGINHTADGMELCWGIGSLGNHVFYVSYQMTNVIKSLNDCDILHLQLVSPGLSSRPEKVRARIRSEVAQLDTTNTRAWGFGYEGECTFSDGQVLFESGPKFRQNSSLIALLRFDKGIFQSASRQDRSFSDVWEIAKVGASWDDDDEGIGGILVFVLAAIAAIATMVIGARAIKKKRLRNALGTDSPKSIGWYRDIPFGGDLACSSYVLDYISMGTNSGLQLASALILRLIHDGYLEVVKRDRKVDLVLAKEADGGCGQLERSFLDILKKAAGTDGILQEKEFSRWASKHPEDINSWIVRTSACAEKSLAGGGYRVGGKFSERGRTESRNLVGLKNFLSEATLMKEKDIIEVHLWKEYLVFGALFGIADRVLEQLKDINPQKVEEIDGFDYTTLRSVLYFSRHCADAMASSISSSSSSASGLGGGTSFGGGGGFSGGGAGGGSR